MKTLLLRLEGPMQSWGGSSRFTERDTTLEPTKSGVLGLLCAAFGKPRYEVPEHSNKWPTLSALTELKMGVRVDHEGKVGVDFQTAGGGKLGSRAYGVAKANNSKPESVMSWRYFLQDASFLVGLESNNTELLARIWDALKSPVWQIYLGRKSYVPGVPVYLPDGLQNGELLSVLQQYPISTSCLDDKNEYQRFILDQEDTNSGELRTDLPLDFGRRLFGVRRVSVKRLPRPRRSG